MAGSEISFTSLPLAYQKAIQLAQDQHKITIQPLQELTGGKSGAYIYLVSVQPEAEKKVQHLVMKLDRKRPFSSADEVSRHQAVMRLSPPAFVQQHIPEIAYCGIETDEVLVVFYAIAGQSLYNFRTLSKYRQGQQLETLFQATNDILLEEWNQAYHFETLDHPQELLKRWLGFRLNLGQKIEQFICQECRLDPDSIGFLIQGEVFPNPLHYARNPESWGQIRPGDVISGFYHGDLNTNNILARFSHQGDRLDGYYLIDFAMFKENLPLFYDLRYLEMSYLVHAISANTLSNTIDLIIRLAQFPLLGAHQAPVEMAGVSAVIRAGRLSFKTWLEKEHPTLQDDLWGQYWLAGVAAGLSYCHKSGQDPQYRLAGLISAAGNLKKFLNLFDLPMPTEALQLYPSTYLEQGSLRKAPSSSIREASHNLPSQATHFIGREHELEQITALLRQPDLRILTLTGPGGTGKTRLAMEAGRALLADFPDGVYFVDLSPLRDPALVATTTAHTLGIREGGGMPPLENLKHNLVSKQVLLIIDNFEQVIEAATTISELTAAAPQVKILVTSRIALQLRGEHEYFVMPLTVPRHRDLSLDEILKYEAVALFQQQAQSVKSGFEITQSNKTEVIEICQRLDGLPLAIEIAAARVKMLPPKALLQRLDDRLKLLVSGAKDIPDRQQTLTRTIEWSYDLLEPEVQPLFIHLGIFAGGFTLEAAEGVCASLVDVDVFLGIEALLNSSLLRQVDSVVDEPRFDMLQTVREYALMKAEETGIRKNLQESHCRFFSEMASGEMSSGIWGADSVMWLSRIQEENDNFRVALDWAMKDLTHIPEAVAIMTPMTWFWFRYGHLREGRDWTERAMEMTKDLGYSPARSLTLVARGFIALWTGDLYLSVELARESIEINQVLNFDLGLSMSKLCIGVALINRGLDQEAYPHLVDAIELFDQQNQPWNKGIALVHLANVSLGMGEPEEAQQWLEMAMPFMQESGDPWNMAFTYNNYGELARTQENYERAEAYYRKTEQFFEEADAIGDQARLVHTFGYLAMHKGDLQEAESLFRQSLQDFRKLGNHRGIAECLAGLAGVAVVHGDYAWAAPLLGAADRQLKAFGGEWWPADRVEVERSLQFLQATLKEQYQLLWDEGQQMEIDAAINYAAKPILAVGE